MSQSPPVNVTYSIEEVLTQINQKLEKLQEDVTYLKVGQAKLEGKIDVLDEKINGVNRRLDFQEFVSKGVLVGLVVAILGGAAKLFGWIGNP